MNLIEMVAKKCQENGITLILGPDKNINVDGFECSGVFDEEKKILSVALGSTEWETTLLHEFNHIIQWKENCDAWVNFMNSETNCGFSLDDYLNGKEVDMVLLQKLVYDTMSMEMDCERRTSDLLTELGYSKEFVDDYNQKCNAYVLCYHQIQKYRKWYHPDKGAYHYKDLYKQMPIVLIDDLFSEESIRMSEIFKECLAD